MELRSLQARLMLLGQDMTTKISTRLLYSLRQLTETLTTLYTDISPTAQADALNLSLKSKVKELPLCRVKFELSCPGKEVAQTFQANPLLPGVILTDQSKFVGIISQHQFLEIMSSSYGPDLFSRRSLNSLYRFTHQEFLTLKGDVQIVEAARYALQRMGKLVYEPIVVELEPEGYGLLSMHQLLLADSQIHQLTCQLLNEQIDKQSKELRKQIEKLASLEQKEKMESLGQIAATIASDIRNPVRWNNSFEALFTYCKEIKEVLLAYESSITQKPSTITELKEQYSLDLLLEYLPKNLRNMGESTVRITKVIGGLQILLDRLITISNGSQE